MAPFGLDGIDEGGQSGGDFRGLGGGPVELGGFQPEEDEALGQALEGAGEAVGVGEAEALGGGAGGGGLEPGVGGAHAVKGAGTGLAGDDGVDDDDALGLVPGVEQFRRRTVDSADRDLTVLQGGGAEGTDRVVGAVHIAAAEDQGTVFLLPGRLSCARHGLLDSNRERG